ncbi:glycoside hydrolase [Marasmius fiardii PR-910]|nr:glycoside hydrolase [Marasmius fiardii PR-910]
MANSDELDRGRTHTPLPEEYELPRPNFGNETPRDSNNSLQTTPNNSSPLLAQQKYEGDIDESYKKEKGGKRRPLILALIALAVLAIIVLAIVLPVYFVVIKPRQNNDNTASASTGSTSGDAGNGSVGGGQGNPQSPNGATSGGDGSKIITEDGETFIYNNKFGGYWVYDPLNPYNNNARPNSWTPPLNETWDFSKHRINGVNIGGLFVIEPFIVPRFFEKYNAVDEWTLSQAMAADTASGGLSQLEDHYKTFITEKDIAEIAGAGLNWIRLPVPFWAIDTWPGEPFLAKTSWKYILRILGWARKYGIRVNLDLHTIPGSQNGYNHSGKGGQINFLNGVMGVANAQRALNYIRIFTEFISQPEYNNLVPIFGIINEALVDVIGKDVMTSFYFEAHNMIRSITGFGEGKGPYISIHDGFADVNSWNGFLAGADRLILDSHPYFAFGGGANDDPIATGTGMNAGGIWPAQACNAFGPSLNRSRSGFGVTIAGEFSNGYNDCGLFLKGVPGSHTYGGDCGLFQDSSNWNETLKAGLKAFAMASMDGTQDWFFWTWKIGNSTANNRVESPLWSYKLGYENGWIPTDPREANGYCAKLGVNEPFNGQYQAYMTGGVGAGTILATAGLSWPPASINGIPAASMAFAPTYTPTGSVATLPGPSVTKGASSVKGWFNTADNAGAPTTIPGCSYPDGWNAQGAALPATQCGAGGGVAVTAPATTIRTTTRAAPPTSATDDSTRRR